ncbi:facilitated trehalose transporter Tret1 [Halyomorpha halys]|uniref:facilitated trehalose transporter Tret1 n=1 Tax=Halyomorpha halys TaxID=286706 RepID=UPI0006D4F387|nr:facilitated trehalose transporter Tret1-like [Halyomorpha halys]
MKDKDEDKTKKEKAPIKEISTFRRAIPQVLACTANNCILFDNGLVLSMPTIVIAALLDSGGDISLDAEQATWFASIAYLCQPLGSVFSGMMMEPLGRKKSMMLLNIPFLTAWTMLYLANSVATLYIAGAIMGFGVGCTEAPILTYVGEITEPRFRGTLTSYAQLCGSLAYVVLYAIGYLTTWRNTVLCCAAVPVITFIAVSQVPETPIWLISKGRLQEAESALRWLRGWVSPEAVAEELQTMITYQKDEPVKENVISSMQSTEALVNEKTTLLARTKYFLRPEMRRPLLLVIAYFFFFYAAGLQTFRPYMVKVFELLNMPTDPNEATVIISIAGFVGNALCMVLVCYIGKKMLSLISLVMSALSCLLLSAAAFGYLSNSWPYPLFLILSFFTGLGIAPIPWMLQSELYPFRGKCMAAGIAAAASYLIGFAATKSFLFLNSVFQLYGMFLIFGVLSLCGALYLNRKMPETEGKTLAEIEAFFNKKKLLKTPADEPPTYSTYM